ncbi:hypothetical protein HMPREF1584_01147 [Gardnerella vaginalis JCP8481A]|nr:hypothetical protein HMPREF1585_01367 [Gardnerella vaginalis JCP8481B]EPI42082.1 hypothetical protein HMPREF1584_01147 [Gardnerella vaginalis JCP8481A]
MLLAYFVPSLYFSYFWLYLRLLSAICKYLRIFFFILIIFYI